MTNAFKKQITIPLWAAVTGGGVILFLLLMCCALGSAVGSVSSKKVSDDISVTDQPSATTTTATAAPTTAIADPCADRNDCVSYVNLDAPWPLTVPWVQVNCIYHYSSGSKPEKMVWADAPDGKSYALNGTARTFMRDMTPIDNIWVVQTTGVKIDLTPIINVGLLLCK